MDKDRSIVVKGTTLVVTDEVLENVALALYKIQEDIDRLKQQREEIRDEKQDIPSDSLYSAIDGLVENEKRITELLAGLRGDRVPEKD